MKEYWTSLASILGVLAFCQSLLHSLFPPELRYVAVKFLNRTFNVFSSYCYFDITEIDGVNTNELYNAVQLYLSTSLSISSRRLSLTRALNSSSITFGLSNNDCITDNFNGVTLQWEHVITQRQTQTFSWRPLPEEKRGFTLRMKKNHKAVVLHSYLDHIIDKANDIKRKNQERLLYTNPKGGSLDARGHPWESVPFKHPSTFDTLAMDPTVKKCIMDDLLDFTNANEFYQKTGRAWKRGYLLYGPPGTGKSSTIAAMANFLGYDIYDLELTEVHNNSELRKLLMKTSSKSIIVIEDIDCSINLTNRKRNDSNHFSNNQNVEFNYDSDIGYRGGAGGGPHDPAAANNNNNSITLSGLLNFTDGLWSCCGSERIFVFTTNHIEKLDPALLRSGRMDMHIFMSYCSYPALKILLKNYLGYEDGELRHDLAKGLEEYVEKAKMTPADVSEVLIKNRRDKEKAVVELLEALKVKAERSKEKKNLSDADVDVDVDEEEQEKRALESSDKEEFEAEEDEKDDGEEKKNKNKNKNKNKQKSK